MIAHLFINRDSFNPQETDTVKTVAQKLLNFKRLLDHIKQYKDENLVYLNHAKFRETHLLNNGFSELSIVDLLDWHKCQEVFGTRDIAIIIQSLFCYTDRNVTDDEIEEYLPLEDSDNCNGILVMNLNSAYDAKKQIISDINGWLKFRRYYLAKYPNNVEYFLKECMKYFPNICIAYPQNDLKDVIDTHTIQIVNCLSILNDNIRPDLADFKGQGDWPHFLVWLAAKYGLDGASLEGEKDQKFNFVFVTNENIQIERYCESHLKMYQNDKKQKNKHCRIYFSKPQESDIVIYVGYIGEHL
jgi:hypothetical protein